MTIQATNNQKKITVGDEITAANAAWSFNGKIPKAFPKHVRRSVPFYEKGHELICDVSDYFVKPDSVCYELGVSVRELINKLALHNSGKPKVKWIGIDNQVDMITEAKKTTTRKKCHLNSGRRNRF